MRSKAPASPCCARGMASASLSSRTSVGLVRATGPVGMHQVLSMPSLPPKLSTYTTYYDLARPGVLGCQVSSGEELIVPWLLLPPPYGRPVPFWQALAQHADFGSTTAWGGATPTS